MCALVFPVTVAAQMCVEPNGEARRDALTSGALVRFDAVARNPLKTIPSCYFRADLDMKQTEDIW
jgi:hypothetical protein